MADRGGSTGVEILSLVAHSELLGDKSASDLVTLLYEHPAGSDDLPVWVALGLSPCDLVPYVHVGHKP